MPFRHTDAPIDVIGIECGNRIKRTNERLTIPLI